MNIKTNQKESALYIATQRGPTELVQMLTELPGIDVNSKSSDGYTPLIRAMCDSNPEKVKVLLANKKTKLDVVGDQNETGLGYTVWQMCRRNSKESRECFNLFITDERCTCEMVNNKDRDGKSPLMIAVEEGCEEVVNILAEMRTSRVRTMMARQ